MLKRFFGTTLLICSLYLILEIINYDLCYYHTAYPCRFWKPSLVTTKTPRTIKRLNSKDASTNVAKCDIRTIGFDYKCLLHHAKLRVRKGNHLIIIQTNKAFLDLTMNLVCSGMRVGIPKEHFMIWAMDEYSDSYLYNRSIMSFYNPLFFFGTEYAEHYHSAHYNLMMRGRSQFWSLINSLGISFFWIDSDIVITRNIEEMLLRPDASAADMVFQFDSGFTYPMTYLVGRFHDLPPQEGWYEPCGGFFFARNTKATHDFFFRVDELIRNTDLEDQQSMGAISKNADFSRLVVDPDPLNLNVNKGRNIRDKRTSSFTFTYFPQIDVWGGHIAFWNNEEMRNKITPYIYHLNSVGPGNKINNFMTYKLWMIDSEGKCKAGPPVYHISEESSLVKRRYDINSG